MKRSECTPSTRVTMPLEVCDIIYKENHHGEAIGITIINTEGNTSFLGIDRLPSKQKSLVEAIALLQKELKKDLLL